MWGISCAIVSLLLSVANGDGGGAYRKLSPANADFTFDLYRRLSAKTDGKNVFFSPVSVTTSLSMLSLGARGETHSQLFSTLGYGSLAQDEVNEAYKHLLHLMGLANDTMQLDMGNTLALDKGFKPLDKFLEDARHHYASEVFSVHFNDTAQAEAEINRFIATKTHDKITDLVKDLDNKTALVLINYVFFRGQWKMPFDADRTKKGDFWVNETNKVEVDMMSRTGNIEFHRDDDKHVNVVLLPYKGNASMMIILPDVGRMKEVEGYINKDYVRRWHDSVITESVDLFFPKISISVSSSLGDTLKEMGVVDAFKNMADFSGISQEIKLKVSKIEHKAVLDVDETGTEAAAATTVEMVYLTWPENMNLNRPFLLLIVESSTKSILFMGKVCDPTAK